VANWEDPTVTQDAGTKEAIHPDTSNPPMTDSVRDESRSLKDGYTGQ